MNYLNSYLYWTTEIELKIFISWSFLFQITDAISTIFVPWIRIQWKNVEILIRNVGILSMWRVNYAEIHGKVQFSSAQFTSPNLHQKWKIFLFYWFIEIVNLFVRLTKFRKFLHKENKTVINLQIQINSKLKCEKQLYA